MDTLWSAILIAFIIALAYRLLPTIMSWFLSPYVIREAERIVEG